MSVPPPPNQWGSQPPTGGQPVGAQPWGPSPGGQPRGPSPGPPPRGGKGKWIFAGIAVLAVIALTVVITVLVVGKDSGDSPSPTTTSTAGPSDIASANDKGPAAIITEDPTCEPTRPILDTRASVEHNGWDTRDPSIPAAAWTPAMRSQYQAVAQAMRASADQMVPLVKVTPHRVMRELYEQLIVYSRAYADNIPTYTPQDDRLAVVSTTVSNAIGYICAAISYGSAAARGPLVQPLAAPSQVAPVGDPADPKRFITEPNSVCADWLAASTKFSNDTADWLPTDPDIPVSQWSPEQRAINDAVAPVMSAFADELQRLGERGGNPTLQDFAELSAQYRRAYVQSLPTYTPSDKYLANSALVLGGVVEAACASVGK
ncbi:MAG: hypothetical protein QOI29_2446 [Mycobacterium sp.]|jgi:hypothetical protein|nr:hypothetical protein [Mycobacterium sp.]MDT5321473.1 hypothetical protein [Mycobacterium sp.]